MYEDDKITILIDRSRYETSLQCARKFYWEYLFQKWGIVTNGSPMYFVVGEAVHVGVQKSMLGFSWPETKDAINAIFQQVLTDKGVALSGELLQEQMDLALALVYTWRKERMYAFHSEYRVLQLADGPAVEREINVVIHETSTHRVILMSRPDVIVQRLSDNAILIWELKTTGVANEEWIKKWEHALQLLLQVRATQSLLESTGIREPVVGIVVEGLVKGIRKRDSFGVKRLSNSLIYSYVKKGVTGVIQDQHSHTWKKGWAKELVSYNMPLEAWIDALPEEVLQDHCRVVPAIMVDGFQVDSVLRQVGSRAIELYAKAQVVSNTADGSTEWRVALDDLFPQTTAACHEFGDCAFLDCCFMQSVGNDPMATGLFKGRTSNHELEKAQQSDPVSL